MAVLQTNTTCDVYRNGNAPPSNPDVAGVKILLTPDFATAHAAAIAQSSTIDRWTHLALMPPATDVRDGYAGAGNGPVGSESQPTGQDFVWIPNKNGTKFGVVFVERFGLGTGQDCKRVYLQRYAPPWPTNNL
jgi:hypothetical protein